MICFLMRFLLLAFSLHLLMTLHRAEPRDTMPDTWAATDALGRVVPMSAEVGAPPQLE